MLAAADLANALDPAAQRPRLRADAELGERITRWGERDAVVHAPGTAYLRLQGAEIDLVRRLDGTVTLGELASEALEADAGVSFDDAIALVVDLQAAALLDRPPIDVFAAIEDHLKPRGVRRRERLLAVARSQTVSWAGADRFVERVYRRGGRLLFSLPVVLASAALIVGGVAALVASSHDQPGGLASAVSGNSGLVLLVMFLAVIFFHEMGHALAVKRARRQIVNAGFRLYLGHPAFFIDSTDLVFATPRQRAVNAVAGPWVEGAIAGAFAIAVWLAPHGPGAAELHRFAAVTYLNVALNLIPFIELDGYWLLSDVLDVPQLRPKSLAVLRHELPARLRRRRPPLTNPERAMAVFAVVGIITTAGAMMLALQLWLPIGRSLVSAGWRAGAFGRIGLVLVLGFAAGPVAQPVVATARALGRRVVAIADDVRFRAESRWRIEAASLLATLPGLGDLDDDALSDLAGRVTRRRVRRGAVVVQQGDAATSFFVIRRGQFEVTERGSDHTDRVIQRLGDGDAFGELALLGHRPRTATVIARSNGDVFEVDAGTFGRMLAPTLAAPALAPALGPALEIQQLPLFRTLSLAEAELLAARAVRRDVGPNEVVVRQGEPAGDFYVLVAGQAQVERDGAVVAALRAGDHFGETALIQRVGRTASVRTVTPAQLLQFDADTFRALIASAFDHHRGRPSGRGLGGEFA